MKKGSDKRPRKGDRAVTPRKTSRASRAELPSRGVQDLEELLPEYDSQLIRDGVRGKYAERYATGTTVVVLEPDVAAAFPDAAAVNAALRALLDVARRQTSAAPRPGSADRGRKPG
jgi:hypothetical protein